MYKLGQSVYIDVNYVVCRRGAFWELEVLSISEHTYRSPMRVGDPFLYDCVCACVCASVRVLCRWAKGKTSYVCYGKNARVLAQVFWRSLINTRPGNQQSIDLAVAFNSDRDATCEARVRFCRFGSKRWSFSQNRRSLRFRTERSDAARLVSLVMLLRGF